VTSDLAKGGRNKEKEKGMNREKSYKRLRAWELAHRFAIEVYKISKGFPAEELYGLTSQIRRSAFSVPLNIVEGQASGSSKEFLRFLNISNRSLAEAEYLLEVVLELDFISKSEYEKLEAIRLEAGLVLNGLIKSMKDKISK
jgi:four helix bundle protein